MKRRTLSTILGLIIIVLIVLAGVFYVKKGGNLTSGGIVKDSGSNISDYSAVFLTNGQVYFGKVNSDTNGSQVDLTDIYYLQVNQTIQPTSTSSTDKTAANNDNVVLVKLGQELHGPNDRMHINQQQVLFTESLTDSSKVITAIKNYQSK